MLTKEILRIKGAALFTCPPEESLEEAIGTMAELDIGSLVVMERGRLAGMLTFREVLKALHEKGPAAAASLKASDVMVRDPEFVGPDMEIDDLRRVMLDTHVRYMPVMDGNTLVGVLSFHDVARAVLEEQSFENRMLKAYIKDWPQ
ncbi:MAG: CBS domain-containing protein [Burkholderiales bacterium]|nr:CBS domain-containing protein [Burkholderiales bacterium]